MIQGGKSGHQNYCIFQYEMQRQKINWAAAEILGPQAAIHKWKESCQILRGKLPKEASAHPGESCDGYDF